VEGLINRHCRVHLTDVRDIHPSPMLETGGLSPSMRPALWTCLVAFQLLFIYLIRRRFFLENARRNVEELLRQADLVR